MREYIPPERRYRRDWQFFKPWQLCVVGFVLAVGIIARAGW